MFPGFKLLLLLLGISNDVDREQSQPQDTGASPNLHNDMLPPSTRTCGKKRYPTQQDVLQNIPYQYPMTKSLTKLQLFNYFMTDLHTVPLARSAPEDQVQASGEGGGGRPEVHLSAGGDDGLLQVEGQHVQQGSDLVIQVSSYLAQRHQVLHRG